MDAPLALYRRYRPDTFEDVIGQEHVTQPLSNALDNNRVHHAYLFSGPRGCGKTTSARIMARALNCEKGPTATPCGTCESCQELATGGPGSIDVIEIDAASHGGVDDTRDLREKAMFGPMKSRYKVYIIDEAHMVSTQGFNALLKLVEEPPAHLRFIFATTEPDKVIGTIKSRTHHYPFRLVPPKVLGDYLLELCRREEVAIEPTAVPLVVRAGGGSVRDSLSVLDQLIGGAGPDGVTYRLATALLGYTPDSLLDETVDALAADDGATVFGVVDKVIESGQDPRRFAEDLLRRLRDLVVVAAVPDAATRGLLEIADDQAGRLAGQAARFGRAELTRAADIVSEGLTEMRGATAPRLLLEMMCARILLPGIDESAEGLGARIDRIERRLSMTGDAAGTPTEQRSTDAEPAAAGPLGTSAAAVAQRSGREQAAGTPPRGQTSSAPAPAAASGADQPSTGAETSRSATAPHVPATEPRSTGSQATGSGPTGSEAPTAGRTVPGQLGLVDVRRLWPGVLERVKAKKKWAWILLSQNAQVKDLDGDTLTIGFSSAGPCKNFRSGDAGRVLHGALVEELGVDWRIEAIIDGSTPSPTAAGQRPVGGESAGTPAGEPANAGAAPSVPTERLPSPQSGGPDDSSSSKESAPAAPTAGHKRGQSTPEPSAPSTPQDDDEVVDDLALSSQELLARELGAEIIDESPTT